MAAVGHTARKVTDHLSTEGLSLMNKGFCLKKTSIEIAREIEAATGERVNPRAISRRAFEWRAAMDRIREKKEEMQALVAAMDEGDLTASAVIKALGLQALMNDPDAFRKQNPLKVQSQNLRAEELIIKREALKLKGREVAVNEGAPPATSGAAAKGRRDRRGVGRQGDAGNGDHTAEDMNRIQGNLRALGPKCGLKHGQKRGNEKCKTKEEAVAAIQERARQGERPTEEEVNKIRNAMGLPDIESNWLAAWPTR